MDCFRVSGRRAAPGSSSSMKQMSGNRMTMKTEYTLLPAFLVLASAMHGQGTVTREKPADYPVRAELPKMQLAAEYLEVVAYPKGSPSHTWASGEFTLKINGRCHALNSQSPGMVAASCAPAGKPHGGSRASRNAHRRDVPAAGFARWRDRRTRQRLPLLPVFWKNQSHPVA